MSLRPGISTRPPPATTWVSARRSVGIGLVEIFSMMLPRTRTLDGAESEGRVPSNMRTFSNTMTAVRSCACAHVAPIDAAATTPCASLRKLRRVGVLMVSCSYCYVVLRAKRNASSNPPRPCEIRLSSSRNPSNQRFNSVKTHPGCMARRTRCKQTLNANENDDSEVRCGGIRIATGACLNVLTADTASGPLACAKIQIS